MHKKLNSFTRMILSCLMIVFLNGLFFYSAAKLPGMPRSMVFIIIQLICCATILLLADKPGASKDQILLNNLKHFNFMNDLEEQEMKTETDKALLEITKSIRRLSADILGTAKTVECSSTLLYKDTKVIEETAGQISISVNEVAEGNTHVADMVQQAAEDVARTSGFIRAIDEDLETIEKNITLAADTVHEGNTAVQLQKKAVSETADKFKDIQLAVSNLDNDTGQIRDIVDTISGISEQTNLLALNAAIEAARAGDAGRGFAVVAQEIRKLADDTKESTTDIQSLIDKIMNEVKNIVSVVQDGSRKMDAQVSSISQTDKAFLEIISSVDMIKQEVGGISEKTRKLTEYSLNVSNAIENVSSVTQQTAAGAQEVSASIQDQAFSLGIIHERVNEFSGKTRQLSEDMKQFKYIKIAHREWDDAIIQYEVFKELARRKLRIAIEGVQVPQAGLFSAVADGSIDATLSPWLPQSGASFMQEYGSQLEELGANMHGCKYGIVVPSYVSIDSIEDMKRYSKEFGGKVYSIERKASISSYVIETLEKYELFGFEADFGSEDTMLKALDRCYKEKQWVAIAGWQPYWIFGEYSLKILKDPKLTMRNEEYTGTLVRKGLRDDHPELYALLKNFKLDIQQLNVAIGKVRKGMPHKQAAIELLDSMK